MSKSIPSFASAIDLLTYIRAAVVKSPRLRPWSYIDRLEERKGELIACANEARAVLSAEYRRLYSTYPILKQAQRLEIIDAAIEKLRTSVKP